MYPTPVWHADKTRWRLDLRVPWDLGRHWLDAPPPPAGSELAIHLSYALLRQLEAKAPAGPQATLPGADGRTFGDALREYLAWRTNVKKWRKKGGERWSREVARRLGRELGSRPLADFAPPQGGRLLLRYRDLCRGGGLPPQLAAKRMADLLVVIKQTLRFAAAADRGWLAACPEFPDARIDSEEVIRVARDKWIDEASFRAARAQLYEDFDGRRGLLTWLRKIDPAAGPEDLHALICARRLYLSWAFYTGLRRHDLDELTSANVSADGRRYARHARKTGARVTTEICPPPLRADIEAELRRLGRPFRRGELICGGRWKNVARVLATACRLAGVERFNLMDCRRSFVWHKAVAGVREEDCVRLLGHRDSRMIRAVYLQVLPASAADADSAAWPEPITDLPGTGPARVLSLVQGRQAGTACHPVDSANPVPERGQDG